jgi:hypothetical protein
VSAVVIAAALSAGGAARELRLVELGFVVLLTGCTVAALALLGTWGRKGR